MGNAIEILIDRKAKKAVELGAQTEIVGRWVWARFAARPSKEVRETMSAEQFRWNSKRGVWQFAGVRCHGSPADSAVIKNKYGAQPVTKEQQAELFIKDHFQVVTVGR